MGLLIVDKETCTKCGICPDVCPGKIIYNRPDSYPRLLPGTDDFCIRCGHCVAVCPSASLDHEEVPLKDCYPLDEALNPSYEQVAQLIRGRRSVREFQDKEVPRELIEEIIGIARYAPTGHNNQEVSWHVVTGRDVVKKLSDIGTDWMRSMAESSTELRDMFAGALKGQEAGLDIFLRNAPAVVTACGPAGNHMAATDCAIALGYFDLAASAAGLGCCWAGFFYVAAATFPAMTRALGLPEGITAYGALMVGYPKYSYARIPARKPADIMWKP